MDTGTELLWTLTVIAAMDLGFISWLVARAARRGRSNGMIASAELLGARARRSRI